MSVEFKIMPIKSKDPTFSQSISLNGSAADILEFLANHLDTSYSDVVRKALKAYAGQIIMENPQYFNEVYRSLILESH